MAKQFELNDKMWEMYNTLSRQGIVNSWADIAKKTGQPLHRLLRWRSMIQEIHYSELDSMCKVLGFELGATFNQTTWKTITRLPKIEVSFQDAENWSLTLRPAEWLETFGTPDKNIHRVDMRNRYVQELETAVLWWESKPFTEQERHVKSMMVSYHLTGQYSQGLTLGQVFSQYKSALRELQKQEPCTSI